MIDLSRVRCTVSDYQQDIFGYTFMCYHIILYGHILSRPINFSVSIKTKSLTIFTLF